VGPLKQQFVRAPELNDFQKLMRRWAALGPYNAGHVMRISGDADLERWRGVITAILREIGVEGCGNLSIAASAQELEATIAQELNLPFASGACPLRAFVVSHDNGSHFLGVIFDHWFADSYSMRLLMHRFFLAYQRPNGGRIDSPVRFATAEDNQILSKGRGGFIAFIASIRSYFRHRRAYRIKLSDPLDFRAGFLLVNFPDGLIDNLRTAAKNGGITVNDLFLAASAQVLGTRSAEARLRSRRNRIALATAVDLRPVAGKALDRVFGFFLSYFTVVLARPEDQPLMKLAAAIARETSAIKSKAEPIRFIVGLRIMRILWDLFREPRLKAQLFPKALPLLAGISNVNLTGSWMDQPADASDVRVMDYLRISPVGPLLPLIFTPSTIGDRLSLGVTYRTTAFSKAEAQQIAQDFASVLTKIQA
jgi:NRPS condensation-like uncharacterized protein